MLDLQTSVAQTSGSNAAQTITVAAPGPNKRIVILSIDASYSTPNIIAPVVASAGVTIYSAVGALSSSASHGVFGTRQIVGGLNEAVTVTVAAGGSSITSTLSITYGISDMTIGAR